MEEIIQKIKENSKGVKSISIPKKTADEHKLLKGSIVKITKMKIVEDN